jgi:sugar phosphate isomerase/epimerase
MKIGLCASVGQASLLAEAGFDYIEENVQKWLEPESPEEVFSAKLGTIRDAALPVQVANSFYPGAIKCTGPEIEMDRVLRYAASAFRRAKLSGIEFIVFGSGGSRQVPEGFDSACAWEQFVAVLRGIAPLAQEHGITAVIEPLNRKECNFITTLEEGAAMVAAADHPQVRLLADIYHMRVNGEDPGDLVKYGRGLRHVHVAELEGRQAPGTAGEDFGPYLRALKEAGYQGAISFEAGWKPETIADGLKGFREQVRAAKLGS